MEPHLFGILAVGRTHSSGRPVKALQCSARSSAITATEQPGCRLPEGRPRLRARRLHDSGSTRRRQSRHRLVQQRRHLPSQFVAQIVRRRPPARSALNFRVAQDTPGEPEVPHSDSEHRPCRRCAETIGKLSWGQKQLVNVPPIGPVLHQARSGRAGPSAQIVGAGPNKEAENLRLPAHCLASTCRALSRTLSCGSPVAARLRLLRASSSSRKRLPTTSTRAEASAAPNAGLQKKGRKRTSQGPSVRCSGVLPHVPRQQRCAGSPARKAGRAHEREDDEEVVREAGRSGPASSGGDMGRSRRGCVTDRDR